MSREQVYSTLDGNAAGGLLREAFAFDATAARTTCARCSATVSMPGLGRSEGLPQPRDGTRRSRRRRERRDRRVLPRYRTRRDRVLVQIPARQT
jgi:hypothetical protein